jgi:hypothetical protein
LTLFVEPLSVQIIVSSLTRPMATSFVDRLCRSMAIIRNARDDSTVDCLSIDTTDLFHVLARYSYVRMVNDEHNERVCRSI